MPNGYELHSVKTDLAQKKASVTLMKKDGFKITSVSVTNFPFDPPGEQTETELKAMALTAAKEHLSAAIAALP